MYDLSDEERTVLEEAQREAADAWAAFKNDPDSLLAMQRCEVSAARQAYLLDILDAASLMLFAETEAAMEASTSRPSTADPPVHLRTFTVFNAPQHAGAVVQHVKGAGVAGAYRVESCRCVRFRLVGRDAAPLDALVAQATTEHTSEPATVFLPADPCDSWANSLDRSRLRDGVFYITVAAQAAAEEFLQAVNVTPKGVEGAQDRGGTGTGGGAGGGCLPSLCPPRVVTISAAARM